MIFSNKHKRIEKLPQGFLIRTLLIVVQEAGYFLGQIVTKTTKTPRCVCTDNVSKEKYVCTIFAVLITFHVNSRLIDFYELIVFTIIVFMNTQENILEGKTVSKTAP